SSYSKIVLQTIHGIFWSTHPGPNGNRKMKVDEDAFHEWRLQQPLLYFEDEEGLQIESSHNSHNFRSIVPLNGPNVYRPLDKRAGSEHLIHTSAPAHT
ncbi:unnamed protein product, partial [Allacma fusca]